MSEKKKQLPVEPGKYRIKQDAFKGEVLSHLNGALCNVKNGATVGVSGKTELVELAGGGGGVFVGADDVEPVA